MSHRRFAITIWKENFNDVKFDKSKVKFLILGKEICPSTKRLHLQGYVETWKKIRQTGLKKIFGENSMHIKQAMTDRATNVNYCKKDGDFFVFNEVTTLMEELEIIISNGTDEYKLMKCHPEIYKDHYDLYLRMKKTIQDRNNEIEFDRYWKEFKLTPLQEILYKKIKEINDVRKIIWIYDKKGNSGKSTLCNYINAIDKNSIILNNAKSSDIAYTYNGESLVLFDIPRTLEGKVNYNILENLKNCRLLSTKYKTVTKKFKCPTVVVFANFKPELEKLSNDRWHIITIMGNAILTNAKW